MVIHDVETITMKRLITLLCIVAACGCASSPRTTWRPSPPSKEVAERLPASIAALDFSKKQSQASVMEQLGLGPWFRSLEFQRGARHCAYSYSMNGAQLLELVIGNGDGIAGVVLFENRTVLVRNVNDDFLHDGQPYKLRSPNK